MRSALNRDNEGYSGSAAETMNPAAARIAQVVRCQLSEVASVLAVQLASLREEGASKPRARARSTVSWRV